MNIKIKNLNHSYDKSKVLTDINLEIRDGQILSIIGPSGCGKSTLLNALIYGSESLNEVEIEEDINIVKPDGTQTTQTKIRKVIERKFDKQVL